MDVHAVGLVGVSLYLLRYALPQIGRLDGNGVAYCWLNLTTAICVLVSLMQHYNLPSILIQVSWINISVVGIFRNAVRNVILPARDQIADEGCTVAAVVPDEVAARGMNRL